MVRRKEQRLSEGFAPTRGVPVRRHVLRGSQLSRVRSRLGNRAGGSGPGTSFTMGFFDADEETLTNLRGPSRTDELNDIFESTVITMISVGIPLSDEIAQGSFLPGAG